MRHEHDEHNELPPHGTITMDTSIVAELHNSNKGQNFSFGQNFSYLKIRSSYTGTGFSYSRPQNHDGFADENKRTQYLCRSYEF